MITPMQLSAVFPKCRNPGNWCRVFNQIAPEFDLQPDHRMAMFLAQTGYESESFNRLREDLSYRTVAHLRAAFPKEFPTDESAQRYVLNPVGLANWVYANRNGNGDVASGDGFKYRGGGLLEVTGRATYRVVGRGLSIDLELRPKQIEQEVIAARSAGFFWRLHDLNTAADEVNFDYTTRAINGSGMLGKDERKALWMKLAAVLGTPAPAVAAAQTRRDTTVPVLDGIMTPGYRAGSVTSDDPSGNQ